MSEAKLRKVIRQMVKEELLREAMTPFQKKVKALFDKKGGKVSDTDSGLRSLIKKNSSEWQQMIDKSFVGKKPGEKVWHWV